MATKKRNVVIDKIEIAQLLLVYADLALEDTIAQVEGVHQVHTNPGSPYYVTPDPRYDIDEIAMDIENAIEAAIQDQTAATIAEAEEVIR